MERNYSADAYGYYKEPINCQTNIAYNEVYHQATHAANTSTILPPYEPEYKDRRYTPSQNNVYYDASYKTDANYKIDKNLQSYRPAGHAKHGTDSYKDSGYYSQYYDPYKMSANVATAVQPQVPKPKESYYHGAHATTNQFPTSKIQSTFCDDAIMQQPAKSSLSKTNSYQVPPPQYMYSNCYNYPTSSQAGYCSYPQSCNEETKVYWDEYQNNRRLMQQTYSQPSLAQQNCSLKDSHTSLEYYKSNYPCQVDTFHQREKQVYGVGSEHLYNNRSPWPPSMQYHLPNTLERSNYYDTQNYDCCSALPPAAQPLSQPHHAVTHSLMPQQRQDNSANFYSNYGKYLPHSMPPQVNQLKYGTATTSSPNPNVYNSQRYYMYNDQQNASYQQNYPKDDCVQSQSNLIYNLDTNETNLNVTYSIEDKNILYKNYQQSQVDGAFAKAGYHPNLMGSVYQDSQKNQLTRSQNLREFLSSWNEDEDEGCDKNDPTNQNAYVGNGLCGSALPGMSMMDYDMSSMNPSNTMENHLQFKSTFATRPKIHVGITVDSNVSNSQYINLPDIIIDIEKSKETESIQPIAKLNEKTVDPIDDQKVAEEVTLRASTGTESLIEKSNFENCNVMNEEAAKILDEENSTVKNSKKMKKLTDAIKRKDNRHWKKKFKHVYALEKINLKRIAKFRKIKRIKLRSKSLNARRFPRKPRKDKSSTPSVDKNVIVKTKKDQSSSLYNPDSLKTLCIDTINTEEFRNLMMSLYELDITTYQEQDSIDLDAGTSVENYENDYNLTYNDETQTNVPKLSALCEYALKDVYDENLFIINLDDENLTNNNNIYLVECDINENITDFQQVTHFDDDETPRDEETTEEIVVSPNNPENLIENNNNICLINNNCSNDPNNCDHILKDLSSIHHEEIVPENYALFKNQNLRNYLHNKYVQKTNFLQVIVINKILKKYQRYLMRKRRGKTISKIINKRSKCNEIE